MKTAGIKKIVTENFVLLSFCYTYFCISIKTVLPENGGTQKVALPKT